MKLMAMVRMLMGFTPPLRLMNTSRPSSAMMMPMAIIENWCVQPSVQMACVQLEGSTNESTSSTTVVAKHST